MNTDSGFFRHIHRYCLLFALCCGIGSAQVYITTGQTGANGKLPGQWTVTPGTGTPSSFTFGGGYFLMGVSTGYTYQLNVRAGSSSGTLLASVTKTAAELCPSSCSGFNNHIFTLATPLTFSAPNSYYVEIIGLDPSNIPESGASAPDGLKNPTTFSWVKSDGTVIDLSTTTAPGAPTSVTGTAGNAQVIVNFTAPAATGGSAILSYLATAVPHAGGSAVTASCTAPVTSCAIPGLTNGTPYDVSVQAVNVIGPGTSTSASNNPVTPSGAAPATSFSFTGPGGGAINTASGNFTVTPDAAFTGNITITPSGGGLSTPIVLAFSNSSTPQTFTVTPTAVGPVTLTPTNDGSLANPSPLIYSTPPAAPAIGNLTPGNGQIAVDFTAPASDGGSPITTYTATCNPGSISGSGTVSPIIVSGLTNGTTYSCSITATNAFGVSTASVAPGSTTPFLPATSFTFTGPGGGAINVASGVFTVTPNAVYTGTITITPSGGGLSTPIVLTFASSAVAQTFTITPTAMGPVTLTPSNGGSLSNPPAISYGTPSAAPVIGAATPGNGSISLAFSAPATNGGSPVTGYTATCNPGGVTASGAGSPIVISGLTNGTAYVCSVTATNAFGISASSGASSPATPLAGATTFTFTGPLGGALNVPSGVFTVAPNSVYNGTITITPSGGGLSSPIVLTFNNSSAAQTFTLTPTAVGPVTLTPSNSGSLANAAPRTYGTPSAAPVIGTPTAGKNSVTVGFFPPTDTGGSPITSYAATCNPGNFTATGYVSPILVSGLNNGSTYTCTVTATNAFGTSASSGASTPVTPVAAATTFTFTGPAGGPINGPSGTFTVTPNATYTGTITIIPSGGGLSSPIVLTFGTSTASQAFTVTPTAVGPVTLTPANNGSLSNPPALTYGTPSAAPVIGTATAGNGSVSVAFTAPASNGGSPITGYTATCNPGGVSVNGSASPILVNGLTNGTAYTCVVTATNAFGASSASAASNSVTPGTGLSVVNAASYQALGIAPGYLGTLFGDKLATSTQIATTTPLPTTLGGTTVVLIDASGQRISLQLYFVSPGQINFVVPDAAKVGPGVLEVTVDGTTTSTPMNVNAVQPGLFSASQNGSGPAIGNVLHRNADGTEFYTSLSTCTGQTLDTCTTVPIQFTTPGQHIYLSFFGTGFRGRSSLDAVVVLINGVQAQVLYSGPQSVYAGLDQLNVELPPSLVGVGTVVVKTTVDGQPSNDVTVAIP